MHRHYESAVEPKGRPTAGATDVVLPHYQWNMLGMPPHHQRQGALPRKAGLPNLGIVRTQQPGLTGEQLTITYFMLVFAGAIGLSL